MQFPPADNRAALARLRAAAAGTPKLEDILERYGVRLLGAFGSTTRDGPGEPRDLDVSVSWERDSSRDLVGLINDLTHAFGPVDLDVMDLDRADPLPRANGLVGIPLYESVRAASPRTRWRRCRRGWTRRGSAVSNWSCWPSEWSGPVNLRAQ